MEQGFRDNKIKVIASTPTLAAGLNLPARRVLIKSYKRYEYGRGMTPISVIEYRQMAGRAGRAGLDTIGEAVLMVRPNQARLVAEVSTTSARAGTISVLQPFQVDLAPALAL